MGQHWQELVPIDRYIVSANGLLHDYDRKVLTFLYQPLIGPTCLSLYMTLWAEIEGNRLWSESSTHHLLMNLLGTNLKTIYDARLKLEGMGLLKTFVKTNESERSFIYELYPPLNPQEFFLDGTLNIYLYRKIGKKHFARLKRFFSDQQQPKEKEFVNVTRAFEDVFESATPGSFQYLHDIPGEFEAEENQQFIGRYEQMPIQIGTKTFDFESLLAGLNESLVPKKALTEKVKEVIANIAFLYNINPIEMKNFLLSAINEKDEIDIESLRKGARDWYQFINDDQLPSLISRTQPIGYQVQLTEPKTPEERLIKFYETTSPIQVFEELSGGAAPSDSDLKTIEEIMFKQKLLPGVVNVLIDFVLKKNDMKFTRGFVESIASHWARKQIKTVRDAMEYARKEDRTYRTMEENKKGVKSPQQKAIRTETPDWLQEEPEKVTKVNLNGKNEDLKAKKREIEEKLKAFRK